MSREHSPQDLPCVRRRRSGRGRSRGSGAGRAAGRRPLHRRRDRSGERRTALTKRRSPHCRRKCRYSASHPVRGASNRDGSPASRRRDSPPPDGEPVDPRRSKRRSSPEGLPDEVERSRRTDSAWPEHGAGKARGGAEAYGDPRRTVTDAESDGSTTSEGRRRAWHRLARGGHRVDVTSKCSNSQAPDVEHFAVATSAIRPP